MKNFYYPNPPQLRKQIKTVALSSMCGRAQKQTTLLVLIMLLLSFNSFGQVDPIKTFYSRVTPADWNNGTSWSFTNEKNKDNDPANETPTANDIVIINNGHSIIITTANATCDKLTLVAGQGNLKTGGSVSIGSDLATKTTTEAVLTLATLEVEIANGKPKENGTWLVGSGNKLVVTNSILRARKGNTETSNSGEMYYELHPGSSIEYASTASTQNIFVLPDLTLFLDADLIKPTLHSGAYKNLILSGTGKKRARIGLKINENLTIRNGAIFSARGATAGSYVHTIGGNVENAGTINVDTATVTNQLQVAGNFTNSSTGTFNALALTHSISGNWSNTGTLNAGTATAPSTIILNGLSKTITTTGSGAFRNLTISSGPATLNSNTTVLGTLDLGAYIYTGTNILQLGGSGQLARPETNEQYITGNLSASRFITSGSASNPTVQAFGNIGIIFTNYGAVTPSDAVIEIIRTTGTVIQNIDVDKVSAARIYDIKTSTLASAPGLQVGFSFIDRELTEAVTEYNLYGERYDEELVKSFTLIPSASSSTTAGHTFTMSEESELGRYTIAATPSNRTPNPVELAWFRVARQKQGVLLTWETASEVDNSGFEVQVSADGKAFRKVEFVKSKTGSSVVAQRYSYTDNATFASGTRYYRLAQIDLDGTTSYSSIKAVAIDGSPVTVAAYPNPFSEGQQVTLHLPAGESRRVSVVMTNALGQVIHNEQVQVQEGQYELLVNTAKAEANGMYLLNIIDKGAKQTFKLVKR
jgi:hypothetical protein